MTDDNDIAALLKRVPPREAPPNDVRERVLHAASLEWQAHKRRRWRLPLALAAGICLSLLATWLITAGTPPMHATVADSHDVRVDGRRQTRGARLTLMPGTRLEAGSATRLTLADATDLRLRAGTKAVWQAPGSILLEAGSLYVDTGPSAHLSVSTVLGEVADIGTVYLASLDDHQLELAVREGAVAVTGANDRVTARAGEGRSGVVIVTPRGITSTTEPAHSARWAWTHEVHAGYRESRVLPLLEAIARDLGLPLVFADSATKASVLTMSIEGDLSDVGPEQALQMILGTTGLTRLPDTEHLKVGIQSDRR